METLFDPCRKQRLAIQVGCFWFCLPAEVRSAHDLPGLELQELLPWIREIDPRAHQKPWQFRYSVLLLAGFLKGHRGNTT